MKYIDIHCHLDSPDYGTEIGDVLLRMKEKEIGAITIGTDLESSRRAVRIAEQNEEVWACIGVHPDEKNELWDTNYELWEELVKNKKVVGIGECGLDYYRLDMGSHSAKATRDEQIALFKQQIEFAMKHDKPLMLHCRSSYDDVLDILEEYNKDAGEKLRGNAHFFAGNIEQAKRFLGLGFTMSFTGVITFTHDYDEVIKFLPLESIMSETDAPFVAPVPHRGKRNEPAFVVGVVERIAETRGEDRGVVSVAMVENAKRVFGLPKN